MNSRDAQSFLAKAVAPQPGTWADLGAGTGTFTLALAHILGPGSTIYAVDRDKGALAKLARAGTVEGVEIVPIVGDFTQALELPRTLRGTLDGLLLGNALHFVPEPARVLGRLVEWLRPGGSVVLIEYDRRRANRWVPYPIDSERLPEIAAGVGLSPPVISGTMPSRFSGTMYIARFSRRAFALRPSQ